MTLEPAERGSQLAKAFASQIQAYDGGRGPPYLTSPISFPKSLCLPRSPQRMSRGVVPL